MGGEGGQSGPPWKRCNAETKTETFFRMWPEITMARFRQCTCAKRVVENQVRRWCRETFPGNGPTKQFYTCSCHETFPGTGPTKQFYTCSCRELVDGDYWFGAGLRAARWYIVPKIPIWVNFGGPCNGRCWYISWPFGLFTAIWYKYFMVVWYIFPRERKKIWQLCLY
jgi:hypothetical protein